MPTPATKPYKAAVAAALAFLSALVVAVQGRTDLDTLGAQGWLLIVISALVVAGGVYSVPNPPATG